ncbi:YceI family protein [Zunongwangia pacifica]|uniref:YceI family protein n=1 Tax=Zunongwangia pacifica TaxID=2911062 RepID=A0A9X1ZLD6_9FLAO|nr:YceI family protein [Zunongwangia pacifica]MCL6216742.1 YceI family protein [Zunongwangia pacifica]
MKTTAILSIFLFISTALFSQKLEQKTLLISKESQLKINGDTNINSFNCVFNPQELPEKLIARFERKQQTLIFKNTSLKLRAKAFDCGSRPINRDFKDLIKAEKYPYIFLDLKELKLTAPNSALVTLNIEIAGIEKPYKVLVKIDDSKSNYTGIINLNINDFKLEPPKKVFGLIKVKEEIQIEFDLYFKS